MPQDQELNKRLKRMWGIAEDKEANKEIPKEDQEFYDNHYDEIVSYYRDNLRYWRYDAPKPQYL